MKLDLRLPRVKFNINTKTLSLLPIQPPPCQENEAHSAADEAEAVAAIEAAEEAEEAARTAAHTAEPRREGMGENDRRRRTSSI